MLRKSIYVKMICGIMLPLLLILTVAGYLILGQVRQSVIQVTTEELTAKSEAAAAELGAYFMTYLQVTQQMQHNSQVHALFAQSPTVKEITYTAAYHNVMITLNNIKEADEYIHRVWVAEFHSSNLYSNGNLVRGLPDYDITAAPWYGELLAQEQVFLTNPYLDDLTGDLLVSAIVPVYNELNGLQTGAAAVDLRVADLHRLMQEQHLGESGFFFLLSEQGRVVYHPNTAQVGLTAGELKISDNLLLALAEREFGPVTYEYDGEVCYGSLAPVGQTGWSVLSALPEAEFFSGYQAVRRMILLIFGLGLAIIAAITMTLGFSIVRPLRRLAQTANRIADGDLSVEVAVAGRDETAKVAVALRRTTERLKYYIDYIDEITIVLKQIAKGNLEFYLTHEYSGEFQRVKVNLLRVRDTLSETIRDIDSAAGQVEVSAEDLALDAGKLADGAARQSDAIHQLKDALRDIAAQVTHTSVNSTRASQEAEDVATSLERSGGQMQELTQAMGQVRKSSQEINKIIQTIEDIAFQTNILALNAAVEASRAGASGRGFAVVAEEVRSLANKSAAAAKDTAELIERSIKSVATGTDLADLATRDILQVVQEARDVSDVLGQISGEAQQQEATLQAISQGIEQIAQVVQVNADSAENSANFSQELKAQSSLLYELLSQFKYQKQPRYLELGPPGKLTD